jgi:hypothetical protein
MGAWLVLYADHRIHVVGRAEAEAAARALRRSRSGEIVTDVLAVVTIIDDEGAA